MYLFGLLAPMFFLRGEKCQGYKEPSLVASKAPLLFTLNTLIYVSMPGKHR